MPYFPGNDFKFRVIFQVKVKELLRFHQSRHQKRDAATIMDIMSHDRVALSHSRFGQGRRTVKVFSGKFVGCRQLYTLAVGVAEEGFSDKMKLERVRDNILKNLWKFGIRTRFWKMDSPKASVTKSPLTAGSTSVPAPPYSWPYSSVPSATGANHEVILRMCKILILFLFCSTIYSQI